MATLIEFICLIYAGRLGQTKYLAGMASPSLLSMFSNDFTLSGLSLGLNALASQAYGAANYKLIASYCHRALFIILIVALVMLLLFLL